MEYHNNYLEYMVQRDGWNVVSLNRYREFPELLDHPMYMFIRYEVSYCKIMQV
jgi:hypothetical protein